jgi:hypothetical protein
VTVALKDVGARLGYAGEPTDVRVTRAGPSGRAVEVTLDGPAGPKAVTGIAFDAALGLRSALFSLRVDTGEAPPPPPPADEVGLQAPPEDAAALAATEVAGPTDAVRSGTEATGGNAATELPPELLVVATWLMTAIAGAAAISVSAWWTRRRPRPAP